MHSGCRVQQCQEPILFEKSNIEKNSGGQSFAEDFGLAATECNLLARSTTNVENTKEKKYGLICVVGLILLFLVHSLLEKCRSGTLLGLKVTKSGLCCWSGSKKKLQKQKQRFLHPLQTT